MPLMKGPVRDLESHPVKEAELLGSFPVGGVRLPLVDATPKQSARLASMREVDVLTDRPPLKMRRRPDALGSAFFAFYLEKEALTDQSRKPAKQNGTHGGLSRRANRRNNDRRKEQHAPSSV